MSLSTRRCGRFLVTALLLSPGALARYGMAEGLGPVRVLTPSVQRYDKVIIASVPDRLPEKPFDPAEISLDAEVTLPSGRSVNVPGFWFQQYRRMLKNPETVGNERVEVLEKVGAPQWRVHFSSGELGAHKVLLKLRDRSGLHSSGVQEFVVTAGAAQGPVRVSPRNPEYLEYESGRAFFPIGQNLCMYQRREGTYYFERLLERLRAGGGNYVRLWQEYYVPRDLKILAGAGDGDFTGFPLETQATGLGRYDLESAWRLDHVADLCQRTDVYWQLAFEMTVWWQRKLEYRWKRNPYNSENGGPCAVPSDYLTNVTAKDLVRRRLRYSVARWGWAANLVAWELWNEVDNNEGFDSKACAAWHREMGGYLKSIDPWKHLVTTSWRDRETFAVPEIDIVQGHSYFGPEYDAAQYTLQDTAHLMRGFGKPFFFGEQGIEGPVGVDPEGKHFHDTLWASALSGAAGTGLYWWWHNYIEPYNLYRHYAPLAGFIHGVDWPAYRWVPVRLSRPSVPVTLNVYGLAAEGRALVWIHDPLAFRIEAGKAARGLEQPAASCNVLGTGDGQYEIEWYDTTTGKLLRRDNGTVNHLNHFGYGLELRPPGFWGDIAARIIRRGLQW